MGEKVYLGDAVYAQFDTVMTGDVLLTTEDGYSITNAIYLEPQVIDAMMKMRQQAAMKAAHLRCLEMEGEIANG